ncbi:hypothetical protein BJ508DRAFT_304303 [Ascobolus immersus RN42]|uniref:Formamidopyrimidine-DNA glycosylase catalytic domain-containing protein n=1 Tax=Ascobolus immersus RN42 TaxID=1160509 RepID=A0A3N4IGF8_ASCIM|nr:hypothetical protein BJ508DRAFT_304303 [Ascobolus immersus RN42]
MPEIGEVAGLVAKLRTHLVNQTIQSATATYHSNVFVNLDAETLEKALIGRKVTETGSWGKYFWIGFSDGKEWLVGHCGMTGWFKFEDAPGPDYIESRDARTPSPSASPVEAEWPPKFTLLEIKPSDSGAVAFIDGRKLSKLRLVTVPEGKTIKDVEPISLNGPDPVQSKLEYSYVSGILKKKKTDIKKLLMDQKFISGIGNWVADDILLHARIHPGTLANALDEEETKRLIASIEYVCKTAVECGGEARKFPKEWLFHLRWGKGKDAKKGLTLVTGEKVEWLDRGRATAYVPEYQVLKGVPKEEKPKGGKKGGKAGGKAKKEESESDADVKDEEDVEEEKPKATKKSTARSKKAAVKTESSEEEEVEEKPKVTQKTPTKRKKAEMEKEEEGEEDAEITNKTPSKKVNPASLSDVAASKRVKVEPKRSNSFSQTKLSFQPSTGTRRSTRTSKQ